jgi:hypothetical protein
MTTVTTGTFAADEAPNTAAVDGKLTGRIEKDYVSGGRASLQPGMDTKDSDFRALRLNPTLAWFLQLAARATEEQQTLWNQHATGSNRRKPRPR